MSDLTQQIKASAVRILQCAPASNPSIGIILGSGLGGFAAKLENPRAISYDELAAFPSPGVGGHAGQLVLGQLHGHSLAVMQGRAHYYERGQIDGMAGAVRTLAAIGCKNLILTNAAGSLSADMPPGHLMLISDHLNLPQISPLFDVPDATRFVDMSDAYDPHLRDLARAAVIELGLDLHEGIYAWFAGPQFETPAEIRMVVKLGADAVGMSTVPETILARHAGMKVLGLSLITNLAAGLSKTPLSHDHTLQAAKLAAKNAEDLLGLIIKKIDL